MDQQYPDDAPVRGTFFDVLFALIVLLASGFSGFTSYLGFSKDLPQYMSISISIIVFLALLAINFKIRAARRNEGSLVAPISLFFLVFVFSFVSNTNAFYSRLIEDDIVRETQEKAWSTFDKQSTQALTKIENSPAYQRNLERISKIENEIQKFKVQITDPQNPGMGSKAREHLDQVVELLGTGTTELKPPPAGSRIDDFRDYANRVEKHIRRLIDEDEKLGVVNRLSGLHAEIEAVRSKHKRRVTHQNYDRKHTEEMRRDLEAIENKTNSYLRQKPELKLESIDDKADEVGKFQYTMRNFVAQVNPVAIILAVMLGLILDILAPVMSIGFYRPTDE